MVNNKKGVSYTTHLSVSIVFLLLFLLQYNLRLIPKIGGASALLLIPAVIAVGAVLGEWPGLFYGLISGFLLDSVTADSVFFCTLVLTVIGFLSGLLISYLFNRNLLSVIILGIGGCTLFFVSKWLLYVFSGYGGVISYFCYHTLPSILYSCVFTVPLFFLIKRLTAGSRHSKKTDR